MRVISRGGESFLVIHYVAPVFLAQISKSNNLKEMDNSKYLVSDVKLTLLDDNIFFSEFLIIYSKSPLVSITVFSNLPLPVNIRPQDYQYCFDNKAGEPRLVMLPSPLSRHKPVLFLAI